MFTKGLSENLEGSTWEQVRGWYCSDLKEIGCEFMEWVQIVHPNGMGSYSPSYGP
jgi:hypothetical protein